ncbi:MAG: hypothetical protein ACFHWZ_06680 [Phycisphaerales bacterium]
MFRLRIHEAKGVAFQKLFEQLMEYDNAEFTRIKPYGSYGDRKNDGYIRSRGCFYQVYAPENPDASRSVLDAARKADEDFQGMLTAWQALTPVREYWFVFNDEYGGCPAPLEQTLLKIGNDHNIHAGATVAKQLEDIAMSLEEDQLLDVIQMPIPSTGFSDSIDFGILGEVIKHIQTMQVPASRESILTAPDFSEKINFNGLSSQVSALLTVGSYQSDAVVDYFSKTLNSRGKNYGIN